MCATHCPAHRYALISDSKVAATHAPQALASLESADLPAQLFIFPAGEWNKTRQFWASLSDELLADGFGRDSAVIALGGGVTGDLGGFVAATYMRGIPVVQVPTSLLSMLDSSVGGKTGIDTPAAKNCIGAFHHPAFVLIDPELLATLPRHQRLAGLAEGVKAAAVADDELFQWIEERSDVLRDGDTEALSELIRRAVAIKAEVVAEDPLEQGRRVILNFGHTAGHALESASEYALLHGEAVAIGMRLESRMGEQAGCTAPGTAARLGHLLDSLDLGCEAAGEHTAEELLRLTESDKKARQGSVRWVFLDRIGQVAADADGAYAHAVGTPECVDWLRDALRELTSAADSSA